MGIRSKGLKYSTSVSRNIGTKEMCLLISNELACRPLELEGALGDIEDVSGV